MEFLSSPIHNYSYETFDDAFFELPKEMDFELNSDLRDSFSYSMNDEDDQTDGMYSIWNAKHPWSLNNNSNSLYNSNLHLDFIGGDPESATMVNPNVVLPNGFHTEEVKPNNSNSILSSTHVPEASSTKAESSMDYEAAEDVTSQVKKPKSKFIVGKETNVPTTNGDCSNKSISSPKNGIRILKPSVVESSSSSASTNTSTSPQTRHDSSSKAKTPVAKNFNNLNKSGFYYQNELFYPKPAFSYSCLIAMALKNSRHGCLPVAEIYNFMCNHFPYFKTAPNGWKNSVRHNLSLNKCFEKIEKPAGSTQRKGCLWALNPSKAAKLEEEVQKCAKKDVVAIKKAMEYPEHLELLERGEMKSLYDGEQSADDDEDDMDTNEEDTECQEPATADDEVLVDDQLSENGDRGAKHGEANSQYPVLVAESNDLPEFKIEVDGSIYEEFIGTIKNEQLFAANGSSTKTNDGGSGNSQKKVKKYYIQVNKGSDEKVAFKSKSESDTFDHYDINNFLRLENEMKLTSGMKTPPRFTKRMVPHSRIKQIKFKTWD